MNEQRATKFLLAHFMHRMNEFFDAHAAEEIEESELGERFARWLYSKDAMHAPFMTEGGGVAQHMNVEQVSDGDSFVIAQLKFFKGRGVGLLWMAELFIKPELAIPDTLRADIVHTLRFHADKVESREIDERTKQVHKSMGGTA